MKTMTFSLLLIAASMRCPVVLGMSTTTAAEERAKSGIGWLVLDTIEYK